MLLGCDASSQAGGQDGYGVAIENRGSIRNAAPRAFLKSEVWLPTAAISKTPKPAASGRPTIEAAHEGEANESHKAKINAHYHLGSKVNGTQRVCPPS